MIRGFRHRGLERYFARSEHKGISLSLEPRIRRILDRLDTAVSPYDMNLPGFRFHALRGMPRRHAVSVSGNWRITFGFADGDAVDVNLEEYH